MSATSSREPLLSGRKAARVRPNRLLVDRLRANSSQLVQTFGDFLASRNATSGTKHQSSRTYDKIVNRQASSRETYRQEIHQRPLKAEWPKQKRGRVGHLLSALLSRRQNNKASLLASLLRAPTVLAALFSLLLVASLMVLYGLSLSHHLSAARESELSEARGPAHRINSRQLAAQALRADGSGADLDAGFARALTVQTECGRLVGVPEGRAIAFRGVAYASPPVGAQRWTRPKPIWLDERLCRANGTNEARDWRRHCAQLSPVTRRFSGHEDCLYLDIYTPQLNQAKKLPVMVYIHGGFLSFGSSGEGQVNWLRARPSAALASELGVVLVAFNYRLQALGFITLVQLAQNNGPDGSEGNYGLWDQLAALNWIKRNIESFSGDPNNIVLFGPDSASALPLALATRRAAEEPAGNIRSAALSARDLFRAAWLTNPTVYHELPFEAASRHYERLFLDQSSCPKVANTTATDRDQSEQMLHCLMGLSAEQVVRQYLGKDDPSYRLDDQNSLPIHGIFADQFVTLDQELVQDSFPFIASARPSGANATSDARYGRPPPVNQAANCFATNCHHPKDLLLGSTAQAVEYWPCPTNLDQWTWDDFRRYVSTSLNSFIADTYKRASELYAVPSPDAFNLSTLGAAGQPQEAASRKQPAETYLSMVSDIRQTCPINELATSLASQRHRVQRYIVETQPSSERSSEGLKEKSVSPDAATPFDQTHRRPKFAYHTWDLFAFLGFEFDPDFKPTPQDLQFQAQIRRMVGRFVHKLDTDGGGGANSDRERHYTVFRKDGTSGQVTDYKADECKMWRKHLERSYAWIS